MNKQTQQSEEQQELEIIKAVAQAWLGHTTATSPPSSTNEFDTRRLNFKNNPTRFKHEAMTKPSRNNNYSNKVVTPWDFNQSLWDAYELVAVSRRLETSLLSENEINESSNGQGSKKKKKKKESKNSLRKILLMDKDRF